MISHVTPATISFGGPQVSLHTPFHLEVSWEKIRAGRANHVTSLLCHLLAGTVLGSVVDTTVCKQKVHKSSKFDRNLLTLQILDAVRYISHNNML